ncbi:MAG TPA: SGNH/GDSL hydrolase family protein [Chloroflexota bacterium]|nr:SGNH/GDSL hydrolase family protein [Chloroflexota bacterium]
MDLWRILALAAGLFLLAACGAWGGELVAPRPLVYVALGASDAVGVGANDPAREGWVPILHQRLPPGTRLVNLGISGSLLRDALKQQLPVAIDAQPDLVTVWLAVNDFNARVPLEEYSAALDELLRQLATRTHAHTLVANLPDLTAVPLYRTVPADLLRAEIARWNAAIAASAARHGAVLVDLYSLGPELAARPDLIGQDGFHPSPQGYRRLAEVMWAAIETHQLLP